MKLRRLVSLLTLVAVLLSLAPLTATADEPVVELTGLFNKNSLTASFETLQWLQNAEAAAGVNITWQEVTTDFDAVKGAIFAAGKAPDIMIRSVSDADLITFEGLFLDLTPYLTEENCPNIMGMLSDYPEIYGQITEESGEIFGIPSFDAFDVTRSNVVNGALWINKTWLDNLGLEMPSTWQEFENVMLAFKEQDANGNGDPSDELCMDMISWRSNWSYQTLAAGAGINLFSNGGDNIQLGFFAEDGVVKNLYADERWKEFILWMKGMYEKGLIHGDFFTKDYDTFVSTARGDGSATAKVGAFITWDPSSHCGDALADQYVICNVLASEEGVVPGATFSTWGNTITKNRVVLAEGCKDIKAALRFIDQFYDTTTNKTGFGIQAYFGGMNEVDNRLYLTEEGQIMRVVPTDGVTDMNTYAWQNGWVNYGPYYNKRIPEELKPWIMYEGQTKEEALAIYWRTQEGMAAGYNEAYKRMTPENVYWEAALTFSASDLEEIAFYNASWVGVVDSVIVPWIIGDKDIEAEWDSYLETLESYGLGNVLEIKQAAYDVWLEKQ